VSVIIPSRDGDRNGAVPRLLRSVESQTYRDFEVKLVIGVAPQGKAINQGADETRGELLLVLDDDTCIADDSVFQRLVDGVDADPAIGMAGASIVVPPDADRFQRSASRQFPRFNMPVVDEVTDSDFACHGCCVIPRHVFERVGREREDLIRGLDPDLRVRLRAAGYRVVLVPGARVYHPLPDGWRAILRIFFRNGYGSAYARKFKPETVYETHERLDSRSYRPRTSFAWRLARYPARLAKAAVSGQFIRLAAYGAYAVGYGWGTLTAREEAVHAGN
jgi:GT2 family glycosyltransferase